MSDPPDHYTALLQRDQPLPSWLIAALPGGAPAPTVSAVLSLLEASALEVLGSEVAETPWFDDARWQLDLTLRVDGERELPVQVWMQPSEKAEALHPLLNATATLFIEHGPPPPGESFPVGADLPLVWLPWEEALDQVPARIQGGRPDRDEAHSAPSAVLFTPGRKLLGLFGRRYRNPGALVPVLEANPVLWVSAMETERMSLLARDRLDRFVDLVRQYAHEEEEWVFLVKLGYAVDDAEDVTEREHLWFQVHGVQGEQVEATLINQPYGIARMNEGDRGLHDLDLLSDWSVICQHGRFDPDTIFHLDRVLDAGEPP